MLLEYCERGSLKDWLRNRYAQWRRLRGEDYFNSGDFRSADGYSNAGEYCDARDVEEIALTADDEEPLSDFVMQQLSYQVACGMEALAAQKVCPSAWV